MGFASEAFTLGPHVVEPGERSRLQLRVARLPTDTWLSLPVEVVNGEREGRALWLTAAVHGDEINGVEIISRVLSLVGPKNLRGTLLAVPIVNVFGFIEQQRYLPDRRDLNRCFPGSAKGSLAGRLAHLLTTEIIMHCSHGIDLHTGTNHRTNLPHLRADLEDEETLALARAFGAPVAVNAPTRRGSLRRTAAERGNKVLLFEGGEAHRYNASAISEGTAGVMRVMRALDMVDHAPPPEREPLVASKTHWLRARRAGMARMDVQLGDRVVPRQSLGIIHDTFGRRVATVRARSEGVVIGMTLNPLVTQGDALVHVANTGAYVGSPGVERAERGTLYEERGTVREEDRYD